MVGEWVDHWLETYKRRNVERSTFARYQDFANLYIKPTIGTVALRRLTGDDIQSFYNTLADKGLHASTISKAASLLGQSLKRAVTVGILPRNPMDDAEAPRRPRRPTFDVPTKEQLRALLATMRQVEASAYPITRFALGSGLREG